MQRHIDYQEDVPCLGLVKLAAGALLYGIECHRPVSIDHNRLTDRVPSRGCRRCWCIPCGGGIATRLCRLWRCIRCSRAFGENAHTAKYSKRKFTEHDPQPGTPFLRWWPWWIQGLPWIGRVALWCVRRVVGSRWIVLNDLLLCAI